ncbi:MAG: SagB family peptide dehydrogenase [Bryobacterales bacterium]|nr:SagB family peptide dehydrogenase [Bryobacterales bacterium]
MSERRVELPPVDEAAVAERDPPFQKVLENRRSRRSGSGRGLTAARLGEFLYRTAHVQESSQSGPVEIQRRPYPAGGALHELEFYVIISRAQDLGAGLYHYQPAEHALYALPATPEQWGELTESARLATRSSTAPDALITLAARIGRIAWKYEGMAYRTILLDAGAVLQTMYLVAAAMDLSPCAVGNGDSVLFAMAAGVSELDEPAVAEFALWV